MRVTISSPAKINLFLAVTGRRADGFHDLVSVAAPLAFGDELVAELGEPLSAGASAGVAEGPAVGMAASQFILECDHPEVPPDDSNLVLKAARAFAAATGWRGRVTFKLTKRIPLGAGLGGGSSNAVATLVALNRLAGGLLAASNLAGLAAGLGSDCAFFLHGGPAVMRGRGERLEALPDSAVERLRDRRVLLFKPSFGISTPWAYQRMAARATDYLPAVEAEGRLMAWVRGRAPVGELLFNNLEGVAFEKFVALPVLLDKLQREFDVPARMSGSGSTCFALPGDDLVTAPLTALVRRCWGPRAFVEETRLA